MTDAAILPALDIAPSPAATDGPAGGEAHEAFEVIPGDPESSIVILGDHATNRVPADYPRTLGLPESEFERHIAFDIGVEALVRGLADRLGARAVLSRFSRLLIDPNRGDTDPTLIMRLSDGAVIPTNHPLPPGERERRIERFWRPYDDAVSRAVEGKIARGIVPVIVSIHSFTPFWRGVPRPWEVGVLWDTDPRAARPMIDMLAADTKLTVGDNEPYSGALGGDMLNRQAHARGLPHALLEVRQDLIAAPPGQAEWIDRLAPIIARVDRIDGLHAVEHFPSKAL